jgi:hypothetical protein
MGVRPEFRNGERHPSHSWRCGLLSYAAGFSGFTQLISAARFRFNHNVEGPGVIA